MTPLWCKVLVTTLALATSGLRARQSRVIGQVQGIGTTAAAPFRGGGAGVGLSAAGRFGAGVFANLGSWDGELAVRAEGAVFFHFDPQKRRGLAPYAGGGVAVQFAGDERAEFLLVILGFESSPAASAGWFVELGVGGGLRGTTGFRVRRPLKEEK